MFLKFLFSRYSFVFLDYQGGEGTGTVYIGMCGSLTLDVAVYTGRTLNNLGHTVLIADFTESEGLHYLFSVSKNFPINYQGIDYTKETDNLWQEYTDNYDYVIVCVQEDIRQIGEYFFSYVYYVSDMEYKHMKNMIEQMKQNRLVSGVILRDMIQEGINAEYLIKYVFRDDYLFRLYAEKRFYQIIEDVFDNEYRIFMQYGDLHNFRRLSMAYLKVIEIIVMEITNMENKMIKKALKDAKEGKVVEKHKYSILEQCIRKKCNKH